MTDSATQLKNATQALRAGNSVTAYFALKKVLKRDPGSLEARLLMAEVHMQEGKPRQAVEIAQELLSREDIDSNPAAAAPLADICLRCEMWFDAARLYAQLCTMNPDNESHRYRAGRAFYKSGQLALARTHFQRCAELRPEHPASYLQLGHIDRAMRDFAAAERNYRAYLERSDNDKAGGFWSLSDLRKYRFTDDDIAAMQRYLATIMEPCPEASLTHFALGIAAEQREDYESAFRNFRAANEMQTQWRPFRAEAYEKLVEGLLSSKAPVARPAEQAAVRPIFIVGLPRSGTTLVEQILAAHSAVIATDELPYMERIAMELERSGGYGQRLASLSDAEATRYRERYLGEARQHLPRGTAYFVDKNPNNFLHIGLISRLLPEARIINLRRELRDNAFSIYRQFFNVGHDYSARFTDIETYASGYLRIMSHWLDRYPDSIRVQSYEELVHEPDGQIAGILAFCGLDEQPGCFEFYKSRQAVKTPSAGQVSRPMYTSSIDHWRHYDKWLSNEFSRLADLSGT